MVVATILAMNVIHARAKINANTGVTNANAKQNAMNVSAVKRKNMLLATNRKKSMTNQIVVVNFTNS